ncbi:MAG TPA: hypothetical protein VGB30_06770 [bacterium]
MRKLLILAVMAVMLTGLNGCVFGGGQADGNLIGTVIREGSNEIIPHPVLIIGRVLKNPTVPDQQIVGDAEGKFEITLNGGNYNVQIGTNINGPFYTWPNPVTVTEYQTTIALFQLPAGF